MQLALSLGALVCLEVVPVITHTTFWLREFDQHQRWTKIHTGMKVTQCRVVKAVFWVWGMEFRLSTLTC